MKTKERIAIYAVLLTLSLLVLGTPLAGTVNASGLLQQLLGPADGVALRQADKPDLLLKAKQGRLSTGDSAYAQVYSVAVVDVVTVVQAYMTQPAILDELNAQVEQARKELSDIERDLVKLQDALEITTDPMRRQQIAQQGQQMTQAYQQKQRQAFAEQSRLRSEHMIEAYGKIVTAVNAVASRDSIDIVLTTRDAELAIEERDPNQILTNILSRTAVRYPSGIDITSKVLAEMDLTQPTEVAPVDAG